MVATAPRVVPATARPGGDGNGANNGNGNPGAPAGAGASDKPGQGAHPATTPQPPKGKPTDKPVKPAATP